jgi:hypothetical protein
MSTAASSYPEAAEDQEQLDRDPTTLMTKKL